ncbi:hypothetical protein ACH4UR_25465 [Streptomyces lydicus]|uniref:hypothetical protein n=1 Tax=Streptomyces lydicus TaxID=47763 RepID=UPI00340F4461
MPLSDTWANIAWASVGAAQVASLAIQMLSKKPDASRQLTIRGALHLTAATLLFELTVGEIKSHDPWEALATAVVGALHLCVASSILSKPQHQADQARRHAARRASESPRKPLGRS